MKNTPRPTTSVTKPTRLTAEDAKTVTKMRVRAGTERRGPALLAIL